MQQRTVRTNAIAALLLTLAAACNGAETREVSAEMQQAPGLRLVIQTERPTVVVGEPVYLTARLINQGQAAARLVPLLKPTDGLLAISIRGPGGEPAGFVPLTIRDTDTPPSELAAGAELATSFPIFYGANGWTMRAPGAYEVRGVFTVHDGSGRPREVRAEPLTIQVTGDGAELSRALMSESAASVEAGKFLLWSGGDQLVEGQKLLAQLAQQYAGAPFADHYHVAAGRSFARAFKDYRRNAVRPADHARAIAELELVRDTVVPAYVRVQKYLALAGSYRALERAADASRAAAAAAALINERPELAEFSEQLNRLR